MLNSHAWMIANDGIGWDRTRLDRTGRDWMRQDETGREAAMLLLGY